MSITYCNINLNSGTGDNPQPLRREYVRSTPILADRSKYHVGIVRASFPLSAVWLWNPELALHVAPPAGQKPTQTVYYCGLLFNAPGNVKITAYAPMHLIVTNVYADVGEPYVAGISRQPSGLYAAVYDYQTIADMYNNAFAAAFTQLQASVAAGGYTFPATAKAPFMTFTNGLFSINLTDYQSYGSGGVQGNIDVYFSASLLSYLDGYQLTVRNISPRVVSPMGQYMDAMLQIPTVQNPTPTSQINIIQQWSTSYVYHALQNIIIVSNGLGVAPENIDRPNYDVSGATVANNWVSSIITDFAPDLSAVGSFRNPLYYNASSVIPGARFSKILGNGPLLSFELMVYWTDSLGRQYPLTTNSSQQGAAIKVCFIPSEML